MKSLFILAAVSLVSAFGNGSQPFSAAMASVDSPYVVLCKAYDKALLTNAEEATLDAMDTYSAYNNGPGATVDCQTKANYFENLDYIDLSSSNITVVSPLATLPNLEEIIIQGNPIHPVPGLRPLADMPNIKVLDYSDNAWAGLICPFADTSTCMTNFPTN